MILLIDFRNFKKECPNGILDKGKVHKIYKQKLLPNSDSKFLVDQLFRIIDDDNNGGIDFKVSQRPGLSARKLYCWFSNSGVPAGSRYGRQWLPGGKTQMDVQVFWLNKISDNIDCDRDIFRLYDEDDSGVIDLEEMNKISTYLYHIDGVSEVKTEVAHW